MIGTPSAGSPSREAATIDSATTASATGLPGSNRSPSTSSTIATTPTASTRQLHLAELPGKQQRPLEEIVPAAGHAEQARQLGHGDGQPGAGLEADEDAVADQLHQHAQPQQPGEQAKRGHGEGGEAGNLRVALRVPFGHRTHRSGDHQRDRRGRPDRQLAGRSEQRVAEPAEQVAVDADLRRQAGKPRIGERNRDRIGRQRHAGDDIAGAARPHGTPPANAPAGIVGATPMRVELPTNWPCGCLTCKRSAEV